jgi:hypothetical protein
MRVVGAGHGPLQRLLPWLVSLALLGVASGLAIWARQQDAARRVAESRAVAAEARALSAETSLTAVAQTVAAATATTVAVSNEPEMALRRALDLVFEAYKDPSEGKLRALSDAFSPEALSFERTEAEHLISGGMRLASSTPPYKLDVLSTSPGSAGRSRLTTREIWTYDEVDSSNRRTRCVREESEQTYALRRVGAGWIVESVTLSGTAHRTDC